MEYWYTVDLGTIEYDNPTNEHYIAIGDFNDALFTTIDYDYQPVQ